jgi:hypothetical protein
LGDWRQARNQCWKWGGELAFPLPKGENCSARTYSFKKEKVMVTQMIIGQPEKDYNLMGFQVWIASPVDCGEERCPLAFNDPAFREGTFAESSDLCFPDPGEDPGCKLGSCFEQRKGLCALPPSITNR